MEDKGTSAEETRQMKTKRLKEEIKNKQYLLDTILKTVKEGILIVNPSNHEIQFMNEFMLRTWGSQTDKPCYKVFYGKKAPCSEELCPVSQAIKGDKPYQSFYRKDRHGHLWEITFSPFQNIDKTESVLLVIRDITENRRLQQELRECKQTFLKELRARYQFSNIIGKSKKMQEIYDLIASVAQTQCTVLIQGESGTGKELIARAIHYNSPQNEGPFVAVSCSVFSENLLESELFGHVKGAFTGAIRNKPGRFELAHGGTLFLDEVGDISLPIEGKLLRVLQDHEFERVGGEKKIKVNLRVIAATNKDIETEIQKGRFREDLYYRLAVIPILVPPLRERIEDIPLLVKHFIAKYKSAFKKDINDISSEAMGVLLNYPWPGNVRELESVLEYVFVRSDGHIINISDFPLRILEAEDRKKEPNGILRIKNSRTDLTRDLLITVLRETKGNRLKAAKMLNISRTTLWRLMKKYQGNWHPSL